MGLVVAATAGLVVWLVLWSLGAKAIDAFMLTTLITLVGCMARMVAPFVPGNKKT